MFLFIEFIILLRSVPRLGSNSNVRIISVGETRRDDDRLND
jgi:hypothetical protein